MRYFIVLVAALIAAPTHTCALGRPLAELHAIVYREAPAAGLDPDVVIAIQRHETGNYTSRLWRQCRNPGGIKRRYGPKAGRYATYATPEEGIRAHLKVFAHPRYAPARRALDPFTQIDAISRAGYAEHSRTWPMHVRRHYRCVRGQHHRGAAE